MRSVDYMSVLRWPAFSRQQTEIRRKTSEGKLHHLRVEKRIEKFSVFNDIVSQSAFQNEAGLFKHACRSGVVRVRLGIDPIQRKFHEAMTHKRRDRFTHNPASPEILAEPIAKLGDVSMHVVTDAYGDAANCRAFGVDTKECVRVTGSGAAQKFIRIPDCVRVRKSIAQSEPDAPVVRMFC